MHVFIQAFFCLDQDEQAKIENLHKKRNLLAAYCKLIVHNVLPIQAATNILKYYVKVTQNFLSYQQKRSSPIDFFSLSVVQQRFR